MKIVLATHKFIPPLVGGVDVYADRLGRALQRLGHTVVVMAFDSTANANGKAITISEEQYNTIKVKRLNFSFDELTKESFDFAFDPELGAVAKKILKDERPDVFIILNFYTITLAPVGAAWELGIPVVHIATDFLPICRRATFIQWNGKSCQIGESHKSCAACFVSHRMLGRLAAPILGYVPEKKLIRWATKWTSYRAPHPFWALKPYLKQVAIMEQRLKTIEPLRQKIDLVLTPTQYTSLLFLENGFSPDQVHFLPFGVEMDHPLARVEHTQAEYVRFLFVGRLQPYKGVHLLIEAFNNLQSPKNATLTIYGTPDGHEEYFENLKTMMGANDHIDFGGQIPPQELGNAFAEADYFILPSSWHENSPLILLDALLSRTPVIASDIGGVTDVIEDGKNGLLFPMGDAHTLQQIMQKVIDQPELAQRLQTGIHPFSIDDYAQKVTDLVRERHT